MKNALSPVLKKLFSPLEVHFHVVHGDITTEDSVNAQNAQKYVAERIAAEMKRYAYRKSDILQIIHLIDTDGAFVPQESVRPMEEAGIRYFQDHIEAGSVEYVFRRNAKKSAVVSKLCTSSKMLAMIPYSIYFFSRNMEHVLHNRPEDLTDEQKIELADAFSDYYENCPEKFISFITADEVSVKGTYGQTWSFIRQGVNSLHRCSNLHLLFCQDSLRHSWETSQ